MPSNIRGTDNFDSGGVIGQNQTWVDVLASRVAGGSYVNDTGRPIMVNIGQDGESGQNFSVDGVIVAKIDATTNVQPTSSIIVPNGATYGTNGPTTIDLWVELR